MSALGRIGAGAPAPEPSAQATSNWQLHLEETLASARRIWIRGRLMRHITPLADAPGVQGSIRQRWWKRKKRKPPVTDGLAPPPSFRLEIRIGGTSLDTQVRPGPDGNFEALSAIDLPSTGRGWRLAKNRLHWDNNTVEASSVVLQPPAQATQAVVVFLPFEFSFSAGGVQRLANQKWAGRLPDFLRAKATAGIPIYYLACVRAESGDPRQAPVSQAELALAGTALGWPGGDFILIPAKRSEELTALTTGLDRLRWLFADSLKLVLLNLEPSVTPIVDSLLEPRPDRAPVNQFIDPEGQRVNGILGIVPRMSHPGEFRPSRGEMLSRHPIVFCHGMLAFSMLKMQIPDNYNCFSILRQPLRDRGYRVFFPQVHPTSGVAERAAQLREQILRWTDDPVNLIAHSMGGLDARYMTSQLGMADHVVSLTTVGTPHSGSYLADWFLTNYRKRVPLLLALEAFGFNVDGFKSCRPAICREFNVNTPDVPTVGYFSYGGDVPQSRLSPFLRRAWHILAQVEGPNDGMVSVASARWGEYLGTVHADHFAQTPDATFLRAGEDFDSVGFFTRLVEDLARRGF
jgi:triacylglycerol lipase